MPSPRCRRPLASCRWIAALAAAGALQAADATGLSLPHVFGDHMVLQAGMSVPVWGWGPPGTAVSVRFAGQEQHATVAPDGSWRVVLTPLAVDARAQDLSVAGATALTFHDVLVGEVWLCSGQSNMEKPLGLQHGQQPTFNYQEEEQQAEYPTIRLLAVPRGRKPVPQTDVPATWTACSGATLEATRFSAAGYYFARSLSHALQVPIGVIASSYGGSPIQCWLPREALSLAPSLAGYVQQAAHPYVAGNPQLSVMYNAQIAPLVPFALRGVLWYQGEANVGSLAEVHRYADEMYALITGWRQAWHEDFPFYEVQIAPFAYYGRAGSKRVDAPDREALLWEQQMDVLRIPHTGMVVTTDITDDVHDIHPRDKKDVGERLARWALAKDYGHGDVVYSGPLYRSMQVDGGAVVLHFDYADGLKSRDGKPLTWFEIAGPDGAFLPATATIAHDTLVVANPSVAHPARVRFAWNELATPNLCNGAGLPASPFRTDPDPWTPPGPGIP